MASKKPITIPGINLVDWNIVKTFYKSKRKGILKVASAELNKFLAIERKKIEENKGDVEKLDSAR